MNDRVNGALARLRSLRWTGPGRNARVEQILKECSHMNADRGRHEGRRWGRVAIGTALAVTFAGGALAGAVHSTPHSWRRLGASWIGRMSRSSLGLGPRR